MAKRDFVSVNLIGDKDTGFRFTAVADDGTAWIANAYNGQASEGDRRRALEPHTWVQIKPLPEKEAKPLPKLNLG